MLKNNYGEHFIYLLHTHYGLIRISNFLFLRFLSFVHSIVHLAFCSSSTYPTSSSHCCCSPTGFTHWASFNFTCPFACGAQILLVCLCMYVSMRVCLCVYVVKKLNGTKSMKEQGEQRPRFEEIVHKNHSLYVMNENSKQIKLKR